MEYLIAKAIQEGREKKRNRLKKDPERQRFKKEALESKNSLKNFRENAENMHKTVLWDNDKACMTENT